MHIQGCWKRTTSSGTHRLVFSSAQTATQCCGRTGYLTALLQVGRRFKVRSAYMLPLWWSKVLCNAYFGVVMLNCEIIKESATIMIVNETHSGHSGVLGIGICV